MSQWVGFMVSIECADNKGCFQGEIKAATNTCITLTKAFCEGIPCDEIEISILASDISDLKLIDKQSSLTGRSTVTIAKPIAKRAGRTQSLSEQSASSKPGPAKSKPIDIEPRPGAEYKNGTPNKRDKSKNKWSKGWKDEACFGSPLDDTISKDFDFEKNLALFDKQAIFDKINNSQKPDVIRQADNCRSQKYRHDENVIATMPTTYRQISVPKQEVCEYVTDDGLIVPSVSRALLSKLLAIADAVGLIWERRTELMGRAATEMALQLLGGGHRLNPRNTHQWPTVVVLCGPHRQGGMGVNTARQLSSQGVNTVVYVVDPDSEFLQQELSLYKLTKNSFVTSVASLPVIADLIIVALADGTSSSGQHRKLSDWVNNNRAPVLALDPPASGTPGVLTKFSLVPVLPLSHSAENGKIYLCNLGLPVEVFSEVGIKYRSPFGPKFVIPLHPSDA